jgi:hypothetical protein
MRVQCRRPNPRLQRTRSAPPPSPLSRQPLGRQITSWCGLVLLAIAVTGTSVSAEQQRQSKRQFKGMELYSWQVGREWRYSLLPGTNRSKSSSEIRAPKVTMSSLSELKERLAQLALGESIFWFNPNERPFAYPTADVACDLVEYCNRLSMKLELGRPCAAA